MHRRIYTVDAHTIEALDAVDASIIAHHESVVSITRHTVFYNEDPAPVIVQEVLAPATEEEVASEPIPTPKKKKATTKKGGTTAL